MPVHYNKATKNEMGVQNICSSTPSCPFELGYGNGSYRILKPNSSSFYLDHFFVLILKIKWSNIFELLIIYTYDF